MKKYSISHFINDYILNKLQVNYIGFFNSKKIVQTGLRQHFNLVQLDTIMPVKKIKNKIK